MNPTMHVRTHGEASRPALTAPRVLALSAALALCLPIARAQEAAETSHATPAEMLQEVTVTATRHAEAASKVPISITAFSQEQMDAQGLKQVDDLARYTPGLNINRSSTGSNDIAIRGISSSAGAGTTGIYIDDTPIQVRNLGYNAGSAFPSLFDLERVEVLRGPQGTLFGADSEGGTVRFIQTTPNLSKFTTYDRFEISHTQNGAPSYEAGLAVGGPIIRDALGFRVSAFFRRDGGYIDGISGSYTITDPSGQAGAKSVDFTRTGTPRPNTNWTEVTGLHGALKWAIGDSLTITPSITWQKQHINDGHDLFWWATSDPSGAHYSRPVYDAGDPASNPALNAINAPNREAGGDRFYMPALAINLSLGGADLVSNTSYFNRTGYQWTDTTNFYSSLYGIPVQRGFKAPTLYQDTQSNFVQEVRLQSNDSTRRFTWVAGAFYSHSNQGAAERESENFMENSPVVGLVGAPPAAVTDGPPFGPGTSAFINYFGVPPLPGAVSWTADFHTVDEQKALFAQADFKLTPQWKITAGVRVSRSSLDLRATYGGPENNANYPIYVSGGQPCTPGDCTPGAGSYTPAYASTTASTSGTETTPKLSVSWQMDDNNLFYATAAKGFRPAGASLLVPVSQCGLDLANIGYLDSSGKSTQSSVYQSDSVWSYELGSKNRFAGGKLAIDAGLYQIRWSNIQTNVFLPICAYSFDANLGHATAQGFDLGLRAQPLDGLSIATTFGYNKTTFDANSLTPNGTVLYPKDSGVPGVGAPVTASLSPQYSFKAFNQHALYVRADYSYSNGYRRAGITAPGSSAYDPRYAPIRAYSQLSLRLGASVFGEAGDLSLFINNVTDAHPDLSLTPGGFFGGYGAVWTSSTLRPRTYGLTLTYRGN